MKAVWAQGKKKHKTKQNKNDQSAHQGFKEKSEIHFVLLLFILSVI